MLKKEISKKYSKLLYVIISVVAICFLQKYIIDYILNNSIIKDINDVRLTSTVFFAFIYDGTLAIAGILLYRFVEGKGRKGLGFKIRKKHINFTLAGLALLLLMHILFICITSKMYLAVWNITLFYQVVPLYLLYAVLVRFLFVGIGEEFFFRGYLFKVLEPYGRLVQYGINLLFFVSLHFLGNRFYPLYLIELVIATFLLCYIYEKTGSIWPGVFLHGATDLLATLFSWNMRGVSFVALLWKSKYNLADAFEWLYIISNILLVMLTWYFYERRLKIENIE